MVCDSNECKRRFFCLLLGGFRTFPNDEKVFEMRFVENSLLLDGLLLPTRTFPPFLTPLICGC